MKAWTLTAAALAATLALAGCTEDGPAVAAVPELEPGDPAIYAPDGWPLQIGDVVWLHERAKIEANFPQLAIITTLGQTVPLGHAGPILGPGDRFYGARFKRVTDPAIIPGQYRYEGHFPERINSVWREYESQLPPEFHGKLDYYEVSNTRPAVYSGSHVVIYDNPDGTVRVETISTRSWPEPATELKR